MAEKTKSLKEVHLKNRKALRKWLEKNHLQKESVWLILHKKNSQTGSLSYIDAVEEGLCFGWIDSKGNKIDNETFKLLFTPRKPKSVWSKINKARIEKLTKDRLMQPAGLAKIEAAKKDGSWTTLDAIEKLIMPEDLLKALSKNKNAQIHFNNFPPSVRKQLFLWIISAKREETRKKRVDEIVTQASKNIRANQYQPK